MSIKEPKKRVGRCRQASIHDRDRDRRFLEFFLNNFVRSYEVTYSDRDRDRDFFGDSDRRLFDLDRLRDFERLFDRLLERRALRQQV